MSSLAVGNDAGTRQVRQRRFNAQRDLARGQDRRRTAMGVTESAVVRMLMRRRLRAVVAQVQSHGNRSTGVRGARHMVPGWARQAGQHMSGGQIVMRNKVMPAAQCRDEEQNRNQSLVQQFAHAAKKPAFPASVKPCLARPPNALQSECVRESEKFAPAGAGAKPCVSKKSWQSAIACRPTGSPAGRCQAAIA